MLLTDAVPLPQALSFQENLRDTYHPGITMP